jgi:hypothetical protein
VEHYEFSQILKYPSKDSVVGGLMKCDAVIARKIEERAKLQQEIDDIRARRDQLIAINATIPQ